MLPDFLKTKEKLNKMLNSEMKKAQFRHMSPFADTPKSNLFEGDEFLLFFGIFGELMRPWDRIFSSAI